MTAPTSKTPNKLPRMSGSTGYGLGFFSGFVVAAVGTYLAVTDHGQKLKHKIIKEFKQNQQAITLESVLPNKKSNPESSLIKSSHHLISKIRQLVNSKPEPKLVAKTSSHHLASKKKRYFKKN